MMQIFFVLEYSYGPDGLYMKIAIHHGQLISTIILKLTLYHFAFQQVHKSNGIWAEKILPELS